MNFSSALYCFRFVSMKFSTHANCYELRFQYEHVINKSQWEKFSALESKFIYSIKIVADFYRIRVVSHMWHIRVTAG